MLGNPPYISIHTSSAKGRLWRAALERRAGYVDDLYVHFTDLGFRHLLRPGGGFGFIVSDTFFTLASKEAMRVWLQENTLTHLGQCDPFDATVDAAIFVARKGAVANAEVAGADQPVLFVQARPLRIDGGKERTRPDLALPELPPRGSKALADLVESAHGAGIAHGGFRGLRLHRVPAALYRQTHKRAFFEPLPGAMALHERFNPPVRKLVARWWKRIETSEKFAQNRAALAEYHASLKPGDVTLVGLVAEGGQGMRTANNARFLAYLEGTAQARGIEQSAAAWTRRWLADAEVRPRFRALVKEGGGNPDKPLHERAAWEQAVQALRGEFPDRLGFTKTSLFRIAPPNLIAGPDDFFFAWTQRKAALLARWRGASELDGFWSVQPGKGGERADFSALQDAQEVTDEAFCGLCGALRRWVASENVRREETGEPSIPSAVLGFRSGEDYPDPADAPRIATSYNGFSGVARFAAFRKGDPEGNRWVDNEPLFVDWSAESVEWLSSNPSARWQGYKFFFTAGVTWTAVANHVAMKARFQEPCVFDADSMRLTPVAGTISPRCFLALLNSDVVSYFKMKFIQHTQKWEIGNLRQLPLVIPTADQEERLNRLTDHAIAAKRHEHAGEHPTNALAAAVRAISQELLASAPAYLHPGAQARLLETPADCLGVLERAINWEAEKLYGVEGRGPFNEF